MNLWTALVDGARELAPRTVGGRQRDPVTRAAAADRRAYLGERATELQLRPTWPAALYRRRHVKKRVGTRTVKQPIPARKTVPTSAIIALSWRPARWWFPGVLTIEVAPGHGDPWRWTSTDGTWRLRWWWSTRHADQLAVLHRRLAWVLRAHQLTADRSLTRRGRR